MFIRFYYETLVKRLKFFPVALLVGPRQSGKTTLVRHAAKELGFSYASFDDINSLVSVQLDPLSFLNALVKPSILDEVQRAPELLLPIKKDVDENRHPGRFILTGSANPLVVPKLADALTGRMTICNLWPLSQGEIIGCKESFLDFLFSGEAPHFCCEPFSKETLIEKVSVGGFPTMVEAKDPESRKVWCNDYLALSIQKDINDLSKIEGVAHLPALLYGLACRVGSTLNMEELGRLTHTTSTSIRRYIQLLESLFLIYRLPSWSPNGDKRLAKSPKIHFVDTALLLTVHHIFQRQLLENLTLLGHVVENFVVMELVKQASWHSLQPSLFHYREERGNEVDIVLEAEREVVGIEVKLSSALRTDDVNGLLALKKAAKKNFRKGVVLYMGHETVTLGEDLFAVPLNALWSSLK